MPESTSSGDASGSGAHCDERERLRAAVERLIGPVDMMVRLAGSTGGASFVVDVGERRYHAKLIRRDSSRSLPLAIEFEVLESLARERLAPQPVAYDDVSGVLVTEFLQGFRALGGREFRNRQVLEWACALLVRLHGQSVALPEFRPRKIALSYFDSLGGVAGFDSIEQERAEELLRLSEEWEGRDDSRVPCHGDLIAANFMLGSELMLVDFEYAQLSPPMLDLASLSSMNGFTPEDDRQLLDAYFGRGRAPFSGDEFAKVRRLTTLTAHFWARAQGSGASGVSRFMLEQG